MLNCLLYRFLYITEFLTRSLCLPVSTIFPSLRTIILSALIIVESLCAITSVVLFLVRINIAFWTFCSETASRDEVASSKRINGVSFKIALAIEILCFCPPDNLMPFSPIIVSNDCGNFSIKSVAAANSKASLITKAPKITIKFDDEDGT